MKTLVAAVAIAGALLPSDALAAEYKIKLGGGSAYWGGHPSFAVVTLTAPNRVSIYHTTNTVDQLFGIGKWWDHKVIASRACPVGRDG